MVELDNVERWAKGNNLTLNRAKCTDMVIHDSRRKCQVVMPHLLPDVARVQSMKVLGVQSVRSQPRQQYHQIVCTDYSRPADPPSAWHGRLITPHGVPSSRRSQFDVPYAASAWWGFTSAADRQRIEAVLRPLSEPLIHGKSKTSRFHAA